jgi:hypothetical protein
MGCCRCVALTLTLTRCIECQCCACLLACLLALHALQVWALAAIIFEFVFFVITIVILMNLLIAMMADTYSTIALQANATYQMQFARLVNEYYHACVLPVPINIVERAVDAYMGDRDVNADVNGIHWGRQYTWPSSQLQFRLDMARRKVQVKKETEQALKKNAHKKEL